jgi:hypothetical protein
MCSVYRNQVLSSFMTYHLVYNKSNTRVPLTNHHSGSPEFTSSFSWVRVARSLVFDVVFSRLLFVYFPLVIILSVLRLTASDYLPICPSFDLRLQITYPFVCPSIDGFRLPTHLSVLRLTASDYLPIQYLRFTASDYLPIRYLHRPSVYGFR